MLSFFIITFVALGFVGSIIKGKYWYLLSLLDILHFFLLLQDAYDGNSDSQPVNIDYPFLPLIYLLLSIWLTFNGIAIKESVIQIYKYFKKGGVFSVELDNYISAERKLELVIVRFQAQIIF